MATHDAGQSVSKLMEWQQAVRGDLQSSCIKVSQPDQLLAALCKLSQEMGFTLDASLRVVGALLVLL